jgi:hypothetical protein
MRERVPGKGTTLRPAVSKRQNAPGFDGGGAVDDIGCLGEGPEIALGALKRQVQVEQDARHFQINGRADIRHRMVSLTVLK